MKMFCSLVCALFMAWNVAADWQSVFSAEVVAWKMDPDPVAAVERLQKAEEEASAEDKRHLTLAIALLQTQWQYRYRVEKSEVDLRESMACLLSNAAYYVDIQAKPFLHFETRKMPQIPGMSALALLVSAFEWTIAERAQLEAVAKAEEDWTAYGYNCILALKALNNGEEYENACDAALQDELLLDEFRAMVYAAKALQCHKPEQIDRAVAYLQEGLALAQLHETRAMLQSILNEHRQTEVKIDAFPSLLPPGEKATLKVRYRNTEQLTINYSGALKDTDTVYLRDPTHRYDWAETEIELPPFPEGMVMVEVVPKTTFEEVEGQSVEHKIVVSPLNVTQLLRTPLVCLVTDARSGAPQAGARVTLHYEDKQVAAQTDERGIVCFEGVPGGGVMVHVVSGEKTLEWAFNASSPVKNDAKKEYRILFDRAVYRPGETVHWQLFARSFEAGKGVSQPAQIEEGLRFSGQGYNGFRLIEEVQVKTSEAGTASGSFVLPKDFTGDVECGVAYAHLGVGFKVFEYRANALQLTMDTLTAPTGKWREPHTLKGTLFDTSGTPADGAQITLTYEDDRGRHTETTEVAQDGHYAITFVPKFSKAKKEDECAITLDLKAVARNGEQTELRKYVRFLRHGYTLQLEVADWIVEGDPVSIAVKATPPQGGVSVVQSETPLVVKGTLRVYEQRADEEDRLLGSGVLASDAPLEGKPEPGAYTLVFESDDGIETMKSFEVLPKTRAPICFNGRDAVLRLKQKNGQALSVGETLEGFAWARGTGPANLYVLTAKGVHAIHPIDNPFFTLPITEALEGGFELAVVGFDNAHLLKATKACRVVKANALQLEMVRFQEKVLPATEQTWELTVDDPNVEVVLTCYDAALDSVTAYSWLDVVLPMRRYMLHWRNVAPFFSQCYMHFSEHLPRDFTPMRYRSHADRNVKMAKTSMSYEAPVQANSMDESAGEAVPAAGFGGNEPPLRSNFATTALWSPQRKVENGKVTFTFKLPDSLTTWKVMALAYTPDGRQGVLEKTCIASTPVMLKPYAPRFMRRGDTVQLNLLVSNTTEQTLETWVECMDGDRQTVTLPPKQSKTLTWQVSAPAEGEEMQLHFVSPMDAVLIKVPIYDNLVAVEEVLPLSLRDTQPFTVDLSKVPQDATISVEWESSPTATVIASLQEVLKQKTCHSSESRFARVMAMILLERLTGEVQPELPNTLDQLMKMRTGTATWPWFEGGKTNEWSTATIALGCAQLQRIGALPDVLQQAFSKQPWNDQSIPLRAYTSHLREKAIATGSALAERMATRMAEHLPRNEERMLTVAAWENELTSMALLGTQSMLERMSSSPIWGNWWQTRSPAWWRWLENPITHHTLSMEVLRLAKKEEEVKGAALWLLQHRRFNQWGDASSTTLAAYALLQSGLTFEPPPEIAVTKEAGSMTFTRPTPGFTFGRLVASYTADPTLLPPPREEETLPVTLTVTWPQETLSVGQTLKGVVQCDAAQDMERLILEIPRPASTEPTMMRPQWRYHGDLFTYCVPHDTGMTVYIENLPRGKYTVPFEFNVTHAGTCTTAPTNLLTPNSSPLTPNSSLYAPGIRLTTIP